MTEPQSETTTTGALPTADADQELAAIQTVLGALTGLQPEQRQRVIDYVFQRLGLQRSAAPPTNAPVVQVATPSLSAAPISDIRSLKELKKPRSANEMAALVAYYLAELAPEGSRKTDITIEDITTYFKQAPYPLPSVLRNTLVNAKAAGYFDSAAHGAYRLNPVGHNLVVHSLPSAGAESGKSSHKKRKKPKDARAKKR